MDGDTISEIARRYSVGSADIVSVNKLRDAGSIRIGMDLMIPGAMKRTSTSTDTIVVSAPKTSINRQATTTRDSNDAKIDTDTPTRISSAT